MLLDLMFQEVRQQLEEFFKLIFQDMQNLSIMRDLLPQEIKRQDRIYRVDYHWIPSRENIDDRIMIVMTDITTEKRLQEKLRLDEERNKFIIKIAVDRHGFLNFLGEIQYCLKEINGWLQKTAEEISIDGLMRHFHTIKGGMASYYLHKVSEKADEIESVLAAIRSGEEQFSKELIEELKNSTSELESILEKELEKMQNLIPKELLQASHIGFYNTSETKISELENSLRDYMKTDPRIRRAVLNIRKQPVRNVLKKYASDAEQLALKLGKKISVQLEGENIEIIHKPFRRLFSNLIHLIRNSVDHGIETPGIRQMLGKTEEGLLKISVQHSENLLKITIADDGSGVDEEVIKEIAQKRGLITPDQTASMDRQSALKLIFVPGFSTKKEISDVSGRGVGMDAVAQAVEELGGGNQY